MKQELIGLIWKMRGNPESKLVLLTLAFSFEDDVFVWTESLNDWLQQRTGIPKIKIVDILINLENAGYLIAQDDSSERERINFDLLREMKS